MIDFVLFYNLLCKINMVVFIDDDYKYWKKIVFLKLINIKLIYVEEVINV